MTAPRYRRLAPVSCVTVWGVPDGVHLSVEEWEPKLREWVTGVALCGQSAEQGALAPDSEVTCRDCDGFRESYERALTGGQALLPRRSDAVEQWLKQQRDLCFGHATTYNAVDGLLDQYRLHADTGTPLDQHVCEGGTVDDCADCYNQAQQR